MHFIKHFINKYGVFVGGGSLATVLVSFVLMAYVTRGIVLIFIPLVIFWFVAMELSKYYLDKKHNRKDK
jgi:hypothetical protein